jgi:hypothetical protein
MDKDQAKSLIGDQIRKLQTLSKLLDDPAVMGMLSQILKLQPSLDSNSPDSFAAPQRSKPRGKGRGRGELAKAALQIVSDSPKELSAREVADRLTAQGFDFGEASKPKEIVISKALRRLAVQKAVVSRRSGPGKKSAILYRSPMLLPLEDSAQKELTQ